MVLTERVLLILLFSTVTFGFASSEDESIKDVKIRCYTGKTHTDFNEYDLKEALNLYETFNQTVKTIIYISGWRETLDESPPTAAMINALRQHTDNNVCALNYDKLALKFYPTVVDNIPTLAEKVAVVLKHWIRNGLDCSKIHLIGFSLGAHISGVIARAIRFKAIKIGRISGLDPAMPMFCDGDKVTSWNALNKVNADFVDVIHSDMWIFGCAARLGHADFYPNGGKRPQPGCGDDFMQFAKLFTGDFCAHTAAVYYFVNTIEADGEPIYMAKNRENQLNTEQMGYYCSTSAVGDYDLTTD